MIQLGNQAGVPGAANEISLVLKTKGVVLLPKHVFKHIDQVLSPRGPCMAAIDGLENTKSYRP
jgi:hypothetical protein